MSKHNNTHFLQLTRDLWDDEYKTLSINAKWLFICLNELEQRFCGKSDHFHYSNTQLAEMTGMSISTVKRAKRELKEHAMGLILIYTKTLIAERKGEEKEYQLTYYKILR